MSRRLPAVTARQLIKVLEANGWELDRIRGSHHVFKHPRFYNHLVVPVHGRQLGRGLVVTILKNAAMTREEFLRQL